MKNLPIPAPTNEPRTCVFCGKSLRAHHWSSGKHVLRETATPEQLENWPLTHWYEYHLAENADVYKCSTYRSSAYFDNPTAPTGLSDYNGSYHRRTLQGDGLFCSKPCAVQFARVAANMGFRLPTHTTDQRKQAQQHGKFLQEFAPYELEPEPREQREPDGTWKCKTRSSTETVRNWTDFSNLVPYTGKRQPPKSKRVIRKK